MLTLNPLDIATGAEGGDVTIGNSAEEGLIGDFDLVGLFRWLRRDAILLGAIVILGLLCTMLFVNKAEKLADRKDDILHKVGILLLICSIIWVLNLIASVLDAVF